MDTLGLLAPRLAALREKYSALVKPQVAAIMENHIESLRTSGALERALNVLDEAPAFALEDGHGNVVRSADLLREGPLVVTFFRGTWCPYCVAELRALAEFQPQFAARGARLVVVSPQLPNARDPQIEAELRLTILHDRDNLVAHAYGLAYDFPADLRGLYGNVFGNDIGAINGSRRWQLPIPARYVINTQGVIISAAVDPDYRDRPEPFETLQALNDIL